MYPEDLKYSKDHEWVRLDGDDCVFGITDFAQGELGEVVYVELPEIGDSYEAGDEKAYEKAVGEYFHNLQLKCGQYRIKYVMADINEGFNKILTTYLVERQKFG